MKFVISRTSVWDDKKPYKKAIKEKIEYWHTRTVSEEEFDKKFSISEGKWRSKGTGHKITRNGYISRREEDEEKWIINIDTLEELIKFKDEVGKIIIKYYYFSDVDNPIMEIEIYDDYRE